MVVRIEPGFLDLNQPPLRDLKAMKRFEDLPEEPMLKLMHIVMPSKNEKDKVTRWREADAAEYFESRTYTSEMTITKHVNYSWPREDPKHKDEAKVFADSIIPDRDGFLARVQWLMLNVTIDLNGLLNPQKIQELTKALAPFTGLKQLDITLKVHTQQQAFEDETQKRLESYLRAYSRDHKCDVFIRWEESSEAYFNDTKMERVAMDGAMDPRLNLEGLDDRNRAFRCFFYSQPFHG